VERLRPLRVRAQRVEIPDPTIDAHRSACASPAVALRADVHDLAAVSHTIAVALASHDLHVPFPILQRPWLKGLITASGFRRSGHKWR